jgi:class 3 adenylate cyclase/tetratricopeptide (TPR) repeat protein
MAACPQCGAENRAEARFCDTCGAALVAEPGDAREERKVVTVLFADLVGFTSRAELMDPEDVRAVLEPYHARLRSELERRGGTVEKFIGDAVMALFGAPTAHEDDPERAVRAALAIRDWIREEGDLQVRVAVTTGEALVALGARPTAGEGMASGDVVNTGARLQAAAPVNGILVDETTYRSTQQPISYEAREPVEAKGKSQPIPVWEAIEARSRFGVDVARTGGAPLVGRESEVGLLRDTLQRARQERSTQLVTLVGVPGIGKSRLVSELFTALEEEPELMYWRQGRCLPYGEGVTYWALSEMVKAHAGILETDSVDKVQEKLAGVVAEALEGVSDREWVEGHLRPLVGLAEEEHVGGDRQAEAFAAWRRFLEALAERSPLVLVFEDLHWADDSLLDFIDHLVEWAGGVPMLVVCTARPELLTRRPGWGGGKPNAVTISLAPLSDDDTARLVHALLERSVLPADLQATLIERAGGNPLYAEEFARMVEELGDDGSGLRLPESVQGIIAARLDALPVDEKLLLQDAAVVGKVFWLGALERIGGRDRREAELLLHRLERKEFVRRERRSTVGEESQYVFSHLLVGDVAYSQIPRAARSEKHQGAAEWIESLGRPEDHAEMLAHHYLTALELDRAAGTKTAELATRARLRLREAGDRAYALSAFPAARGFYTGALELWPADDEGRADLLFRYARSAHSFEPTTSLDLIIEARDALRAAGDRAQTAEAEILAGEAFWLLGRRDEGFERVRAAEALIADQPSSYSKAYVLANLSRFTALAGENEEAIGFGRGALAMADDLDLVVIRSHALNNMGFARVAIGDAGGIDDLEQSAEIALAANSIESVRAYGNLASVLSDLGELERARAMRVEAGRLGERFGLHSWMMWIRGDQCWELYFEGRWDEALETLDALISEAAEGGFWIETPLRVLRGRIRLARDDVRGAQDDASRALERAEAAKDPQVMWPALAFGARAFVANDRSRAETLASELLSAWEEHGLGIGGDFAWLSDLAVALAALGGESELGMLVERSMVKTPWRTAAAAYVSGDFQAAAAEYSAIGALPEEADARLRAAEILVGAGRRAEAEAELEHSFAFWRSVGATAYVREGEALLAAGASADAGRSGTS